MRRRVWGAAVAALALALAASGPLAADLPTLIVDAPPELAPLAERVRGFDRSRLATAMNLTGLTDPGPPILLLLATDRTELATRAPGWAAGYADGGRGVIVVLTDRIPKYPHESLEAVIQHEVAHVLVARAAGGRPVPRWFNEGVAMAAARVWTIEDRTHLAWGMLTGGPDDLGGLETAFHGAGAVDARAAYALSSALVRELQSQAGPEVTGNLLRQVAAGASFEEAFAAVVGQPLSRFAGRFFRRQTLWNRWVPVVTSSATLWIVITLLALVAFRRRRQRDAALAQRWEAEDAWRTRVRVEPPDEVIN